MTEFGYPIRTSLRRERCGKCLRYISSRRRHSCHSPYSGDVVKIDVYDPIYDLLMGRLRNEHDRLWVDMARAAFVSLPKANVMAAIGERLGGTWFSVLFSGNRSIMARPELLYESGITGVVYVNMDNSVIYLPDVITEIVSDELPVQKWIV